MTTHPIDAPSSTTCPRPIPKRSPMMDTGLMHDDPSVEVPPSLLSPGDHIWAGREGELEWKRVERVEYRPGGWSHNGLGHPTTERPSLHVIFCSDGWEQVVLRGDEIEVRIGAASTPPIPRPSVDSPDSEG